MHEDDRQLPWTRETHYRRDRRSVRAAREFAAQALTDWGAAGGRADDVLLCVSELATNAVRHGAPPGRGYLLRLLLDGGGQLRVEVHDSGDGLTAVRERRAGADDETGRGLALVAGLASKWGVAHRVPGKVVWCEFAPESTPFPAA